MRRVTRPSVAIITTSFPSHNASDRPSGAAARFRRPFPLKSALSANAKLNIAMDVEKRSYRRETRFLRSRGTMRPLPQPADSASLFHIDRVQTSATFVVAAAHKELLPSTSHTFDMCPTAMGFIEHNGARSYRNILLGRTGRGSRLTDAWMWHFLVPGLTADQTLARAPPRRWCPPTLLPAPRRRDRAPRGRAAAAAGQSPRRCHSRPSVAGMNAALRRMVGMAATRLRVSASAASAPSLSGTSTSTLERLL